MRRLLRSLTLAVTLLVLSLVAPVTLPVRAHQSTAASQDPQTQTVYITKTGKKYHRDGCRYLASSKTPISLKDAKARGYTACKVCHPPT